MSKHYSQELKNAALEKLLSPNKQSLYKVSETMGIPASTLYGWKQSCGNTRSMKKNKKFASYTREQKFDLLLKTSAMSENERGVFLRENGLHSDDLTNLREEIIKGPEAPKNPTVPPETIELRRTLHKLENELKRKDRALSEFAARVILLKKSQEIWGDPEDDK